MRVLWWRTWSLVAYLLLLVPFVFATFVGHWLSGAWWPGLVLAGLVACACLVALWRSARHVLTDIDAVMIDREHHPGLYGLLDDLAKRAHLHRAIQLATVGTPDAGVNAVTVFTLSGPVIAVTHELLAGFTSEELYGVLGHEVGHVAHHDGPWHTFATVQAQVTSKVSRGFARVLALLSSGAAAPDVGVVTRLLVGVICAVLGLVVLFIGVFTPFGLWWTVASFDRSRERLADLTSVQLCSSPAPLLSALHRLEGSPPASQHRWLHRPPAGMLHRAAARLGADHPDLASRTKMLEHLSA